MARRRDVELETAIADELREVTSDGKRRTYVELAAHLDERGFRLPWKKGRWTAERVKAVAERNGVDCNVARVRRVRAEKPAIYKSLWGRELKWYGARQKNSF